MKKRIKEIIKNKGKIPKQVAKDILQARIDIDKENREEDIRLRASLGV